MSIQGIELAANTVVGQDDIRKAGYGFVVGHLGAGSGEQLSTARANEYISAGLTIVSVYDAPTQPNGGTPIGYDPGLFEDPAAVLRAAVYSAGVTDARNAYSQAKLIGQAPGSAIYFEVDANVNTGMPYVLAYFRGIAEGFATMSAGQQGYKVGVLGSGYVLDSVFDAGLADYKWLAAPTDWQGSAGYSTYDIAAYGTADTATFPGAVVNHDMASEAKPGGDFGQWGISTTVPNLVIYDLTVRPDPLVAGSTATITFSVGNIGSGASPGSTAKLYLSSDAIISSDDTLLGTFDLPSLAQNVAAGDSMAWAIPADFAAGTYYLGIAATPVPGESSTTDNKYAVGFTVFSSVAASNNLVINQLTLGAPGIAAGGTQTVTFEIGNAGPGASTATEAKLYMSTDEAITAADTFLGSFPIPSLAPGAAATRFLSTIIPANTAEGSYYIGVAANPVSGETNINDNVFATGFTVAAALSPAPNLVINDLSLGAALVAAGGSQSVDFAIGNAGQTSAAATTATLYLSTDETISAADQPLGTFDIPALAAGASWGAKFQASIPATTAVGSYYIGVVAAPVAGEPSVNDNAYGVHFSVAHMAGSVTISDLTLSEGNSGTTLATFVVTRTGGTAAFSIDFTTQDGGATTADNDYVAASGTLTFDESVVAQTISVSVNGDLLDETAAAQTFFVTLSGATNGAIIADNQARGLIADDDYQNHAPVLAGRDVRVHAHQQVSGGSMISTVADADGDTITEYAFRDITEGGGFLLLDGVAQPVGAWSTVPATQLGRLSFAGGDQEGLDQIELRAYDGQAWSEVSQLTATTIADLADDYGATPATAGTIGVGGSITGTIETADDRDWLAIPLIAGRTYSFGLEGAATGAGTLADPILELRDASGSSAAIASDDNGGTGGNARLVFPVTKTDTYYLAARSVDATTGTYKLSAAVVPVASLAITALDARRLEGRTGATQFTFTVTRTGDPDIACSATYAVSGSGQHPAFSSDFVDNLLPSGRLDFAPGETSKAIAIAVAGDTAVEDNETFAVTLTSLALDVAIETATAEGLIKDDDTITDLLIVNTTTGQPVATAPIFYNGPVAGLEKEIILITPDNLNASVSGDNWFIHTGSGMDALTAHGGRNVLDGGTGSNFLTGAAGQDSFFLDARNAEADIWSTIVGFAGDDTVTVWGVSAQDAAITWTDNLGAEGFRGLTMQATAPGKPNALVTLVGYSKADLDNGRLHLAFGAPDPASPYLHISGTV